MHRLELWGRRLKNLSEQRKQMAAKSAGPLKGGSELALFCNLHGLCIPLVIRNHFFDLRRGEYL